MTAVGGEDAELDRQVVDPEQREAPGDGLPANAE